MHTLTREVVITEESIKKLTRVRAIDALSEAIWNSIDSDATDINIKTIQDKNTGHLIEIIIKDNGSGIPYKKFNDYFTLFQQSWKKTTRRKNNKLFHGKKGEGRFKLYALAGSATWDTSYIVDNKINNYKINGKQYQPKKFEISKDTKETTEQGTTLSLKNLTDKAQDLNTEALYFDLIAIYALYLESEKNLTIALNGKKLDPSSFIIKQKKGLFDIEIEGITIEIKYRFIAWSDEFKYSDNKHTFFFDADNNYIIEKPSGIQGNIIPHSVFLNAEYFHAFDGLFEEHNGKIDKIRKKYHQLLLDFLFAVKREHSKEEFDKFITELYYPFTETPTTPIEIAQKDIFDLCAFKILEEDPKVLNRKNNSLAILFKLLKKIIEKDENIGTIVSEVLELNEDDSAKFTKILESTALPKLITHYDEIKRRLTFLNVLDDLVHEDFYVKHLKERSQLHKIIEKETWIFGDIFSDNIGTSDQALDAVIKANFTIDNISEKDIESLSKKLKTAKKEDTETLLKKIPDLYLWSGFNSNSGAIINNLVVELKAPKVTIGYSEIEQINTYRRGIMNNTRHRVNDKNRWTYYVVSSKLKNDSTFNSDFEDYDNGLLWNRDPNIKVYCKTWEAIIKESRRNLEKMKKDLVIKISKEEKEVLLDKYLAEVEFTGIKN